MDQNKKQANSSIGCMVTECVHHNKAQDYCTLSAIKVGCCGPTTGSCTCTECDSFRKG